MKIGYARVSFGEQNLNLQLDDLKKEGCEKIFQEKISGAKDKRPIFEEMISQLRPNDFLIGWDINRMGWGLVDIIQTIDKIIAMKVQFKSTSQPFIDTTTDSRKFMFQFFALMADQERKQLITRTNAGLAAS